MNQKQFDFTIKYVSWDPGGSRKKKTTGMTKWDVDGNPRVIEQLGEEDVDRELSNMEDTVELFIIERYIPRPGVSHTGNKLLTARVIGNLEGFARRQGIEVFFQSSSILKIAAMWAQVKPPKGHLPDKISAYLHGYYYLHKNGIIPAKVLEDK